MSCHEPQRNSTGGVYYGMLKQNMSRRSAFPIWDVLILVLIIGFVIAIVSPKFVPDGRGDRKARACIDNLRQIDAAANQFALEHSRTTGSPINFPNDLTPYIKLNSLGKIPSCPNGGTYSISKVGETPTCSLGTNVVPAHVLP